MGKRIKIYLDNCCYNRPFDEIRNIEIDMEIISKLSIQALVKSGHFDLVWSYVLTYENSKNPKKINKENIILWKNIAIENVEENEEVLLLAEKYIDLGVKTLDALHLACSSVAKCDAFVTVDKGILNKNIDFIRVINPIDFMREVVNNANR